MLAHTRRHDGLDQIDSKDSPPEEEGEEVTWHRTPLAQRATAVPSPLLRDEPRNEVGTEGPQVAHTFGSQKAEKCLANLAVHSNGGVTKARCSRRAWR